MEYSDFLFCNKQEAISAAKYIGPEIGISRDETDLLKIAGAIASYKKQNKKRGRVMIITDSHFSVNVAIRYEA